MTISTSPAMYLLVPQILASADLTPKRLREITGCGVTAPYDWVHGRRSPGQRDVPAIAKAAGITAEELHAAIRADRAARAAAAQDRLQQSPLQGGGDVGSGGIDQLQQDREREGDQGVHATVVTVTHPVSRDTK